MALICEGNPLIQLWINCGKSTVHAGTCKLASSSDINKLITVWVWPSAVAMVLRSLTFIPQEENNLPRASFVLF